MRRTTPILTSLAVISVLLLAACQKAISWDDLKPHTVENKLIGEWKFMFLSEKSEIVDELSDSQDAIKTVTKAEYSSINNNGSVSISATSMASANVSFDVSTTVNSDLYDNGVFVNSLAQILAYSVPATSSTVAYQLIDDDSLYFPNGAPILDLSGQSQANGCLYKIDGNRLTLTTNLNSQEQQTSSGITQKTTIKSTGVITLEK